MSLFGPIRWRRRVGRCPHGCTSRRWPPLMRPWGCSRISGRAGNSSPGLCAGGLCAVCHGGPVTGLVLWRRVSPRAVWGWVQAAGHQAMSTSRRNWLPSPRATTARAAAGRGSGLAVGPGGRWGDGAVSSRGRRTAGKIRWREVKVGVLARLGQHRTRTGQASPGSSTVVWWRSWGTSRHSSRAYGSKRSARASRMRPRWSGSVMVAAGCGACLRSSSRPLRRVSWTFTTRRKTYGRARRPGSMAVPQRPVGGLAGHGTASGMAIPTGSWPTWPTPWRWRGCPTRRGPL